MSTGQTEWLPPRVYLEDYSGDVHAYLDALYQYFWEDWISSSPAPFEGKRFALKRHPLLEGKEATFWHFITEGAIESERIPNLRRCECIRWPRPMIEAVPSERVCWWAQQHRGAKRERRIAIALPDFSYVVVLADRGKYVLPWTAYWVDYQHRRDKLRREWQTYKTP